MCFPRKALLFLPAAICLLIIPATTMAQTTGTITGTITDTSGAVIPNVRVVVRNMGTGEERVVQSNNAGLYVAYSLPVGNYEVEASAPGLKKTIRTNIPLDVADRLAINLALPVGDISETVSVTGEAPVVETEKGDVGYTVQQGHLIINL